MIHRVHSRGFPSWLVESVWNLRIFSCLGWSSWSGTREYFPLLAETLHLPLATLAAWRVSTPVSLYFVYGAGRDSLRREPKREASVSLLYSLQPPHHCPPALQYFMAAMARGMEWYGLYEEGDQTREWFSSVTRERGQYMLYALSRIIRRRKPWLVYRIYWLGTADRLYLGCCSDLRILPFDI